MTTMSVSGWMFLPVLGHPGCSGQNPQSRKMVVCVCACYKDIIKHNIKVFGTTTNTWEQVAMDRSKYCAFLHSAAMLAEATRAERVKEKRRRHKDHASPEAGNPALMCPHCGRQFTAQIGLFAHLKWRHWPNQNNRHALLVHRGAVYRSTGVCAVYK